MNKNNCPRCGGTADHLVTDIAGKNYYRCNTNLTSVVVDTPDNAKRFTPCETVIDDNRRIVDARLAYKTGNTIRTMAVRNGIIG